MAKPICDICGEQKIFQLGKAGHKCACNRQRAHCAEIPPEQLRKTWRAMMHPLVLEFWKNLPCECTMTTADILNALEFTGLSLHYRKGHGPDGQV